MSTQTKAAPSVHSAPGRESAVARDWSVQWPYVVGVDDTKQAYPALKYAAELSAATGARVHLVSALKPYNALAAGSPADERTTELRLELREVYLEDLLPRVVAPPVWTRVAKIGDPADILAAEAATVRAGLVILGACRHGTIERILRRPTAMRVIQKTPMPVVVVPRDAKPPRTVVVGVDFSPASMFACRAAAAMLCGSGTLHLVHVEQPALPLPGEVWSVDLTKWQIDGTIDRMGEYDPYTGRSPAVTIERVSLLGEIAPTLERYARSVGAELIAVGSHGYNFAQRTMLGSVSAALLARPTQAVLVTGAAHSRKPIPPPDQRAASRSGDTRTGDRT